MTRSGNGERQGISKHVQLFIPEMRATLTTSISFIFVLPCFHGNSSHRAALCALAGVLELQACTCKSRKFVCLYYQDTC